MNRLIALVLLAAPILLTTTGCETIVLANAKVTQTPITDCPTPSCITEYRGQVDLAGGGRAGIAGITLKDGEKQSFSPISNWAMPDRGDTLLPAAIGAYGQYRAAKETSNGMSQSGGTSTFVFDNDSISDANSSSSTSVIQKTLEQTMPNVHFGGHSNGHAVGSSH